MKHTAPKKIQNNLQSFGMILGGLLFAIFPVMGCKTVQCAPALTCEMQPVDKVVYPKIWTCGKYDSFRLVITKGPYQLKESSIAHLKKVMKEQAGLDVEVVEGTDTGLPADQKVEHKEILAAGLRQIPSSDKPVVVVVVINGVKGVDYNYKGTIYFGQSQLRKIARDSDILLPQDLPPEGRFFCVLVLNRSSFIERWFEDIVLIHEVGHWLGVPVRGFHGGCDKSHCTNGRCLMFSGKWDFPMTMRLLGANLLTGPPRQFGPYCAEELAEMQRQREANKKKLKTEIH